MTRQTEPFDHDVYRAWLTLDGEPGAALEAEEERQLREHLAECGTCRTERDELQRMDALLGGGRISVRQGFGEEVMRRLPAAGWESRSPRSWRLPVAVMLLFGTAAALLLGVHSAETVPGLPLLGAAGAVAEAVTTGLLAGAGMLWASWRGVGLVLDSLLTPSSRVAVVVFVLCLDILILALIARRGSGRVAHAPSGADRGLDRSRGRNGRA